MQKIIGRKKEQQELRRLFDSQKPEFVVIYGRRRVGKTFLVREFFNNSFTFYHTGLSPMELEEKSLLEQQLQNFRISLSRYGYEFDSSPKDWFEAFECLIKLLESKQDNQRQVVFIDELPWMDTPRSGFITAFEHFWNGWAAGRTNLLLIVCGSATSWISDILLNNKGGLYGRTTHEIHLSPFCLKECEDYYQMSGIVMDRYDQLQCYMVMGGIPYYMSYIEKGLSLAQNIDNIYFRKEGKLSKEFERLYASLFTSPDSYIKVVKLLSQRREGFTRQDIATETDIPYGGGLTTVLSSLEASDFIESYIPYGSRSAYYRLTDFYTLFYFHFLEKKKITNPNFWQDNLLSPALNAWRGLTFENVCRIHLPQIKKVLGISGVQTEAYSWHSKGLKDGAQIDLIISRADRVMNICEMKFTSSDFSIDKSYDAILRHKIQVFTDEAKPDRTLHLTLVTTFGLTQNEYSGRIQTVVTMDDLFE